MNMESKLVKLIKKYESLAAHFKEKSNLTTSRDEKIACSCTETILQEVVSDLKSVTGQKVDVVKDGAVEVQPILSQQVFGALRDWDPVKERSGNCMLIGDIGAGKTYLLKENLYTQLNGIEHVYVFTAEEDKAEYKDFTTRFNFHLHTYKEMPEILNNLCVQRNDRVWVYIEGNENLTEDQRKSIIKTSQIGGQYGISITYLAYDLTDFTVSLFQNAAYIICIALNSRCRNIMERCRLLNKNEAELLQIKQGNRPVIIKDINKGNTTTGIICTPGCIRRY